MTDRPPVQCDVCGAYPGVVVRLPEGRMCAKCAPCGDERLVDWPIDRTPEETLRQIIRNCARPATRPRTGVPRWSIVSELTTNGSTYSARLCRWAGVDPDELVVRRK